MAEATNRVDRMVDAVRARRRDPGVPLYVTAAEVFSEAVDDLDQVELLALESVGFEAVRYEGDPPEGRATQDPALAAMLKRGAEDDPAAVGPSTAAKLALLGFTAVMAGKLMCESAANN